MRVPFLKAWDNKSTIIKRINALIKMVENGKSIRASGKGISITQTENGTSITFRPKPDRQIKRAKIKSTFSSGTQVTVELVDADDGAIAGDILVYVNENKTSMTSALSAPKLTAADFKFIMKAIDGDYYLVAPLITVKTECPEA